MQDMFYDVDELYYYVDDAVKVDLMPEDAFMIDALVEAVMENIEYLIPISRDNVNSAVEYEVTTYLEDKTRDFGELI